MNQREMAETALTPASIHELRRYFDRLSSENWLKEDWEAGRACFPATCQIDYHLLTTQSDSRRFH